MVPIRMAKVEGSPLLELEFYAVAVAEASAILIISFEIVTIWRGSAVRGYP
jgi:hypothetical protein